MATLFQEWLGHSNISTTRLVMPYAELAMVRDAQMVAEIPLAEAVPSAAAVPNAMRAGQLAEGPALKAIGSNGKVTFTPTPEQMDSAAFKVIVGSPKFTPTGSPVSTIYDGSVQAGLAEIKSGSSALSST